MKTTKLFFKLQLISIFSFLFFSSSFGQESYLKNRFNLKTAYSRYDTGSSTFVNNKLKAIQTGNYRIEGNYGFYNSIEAGIYLGFSEYSFYDSELLMQNIIVSKNYFSPSYGININVHLLPFLIKEKDFRFDFYTSAKFGGIYFTTPDTYLNHGHFNELFIGGGFTFYIWNHVGFFAEYGFNKILNADQFNLGVNDKLRYGISIKFK